MPRPSRNLIERQNTFQLVKRKNSKDPEALLKLRAVFGGQSVDAVYYLFNCSREMSQIETKLAWLEISALAKV
ncbi:MAG: hypothetical protein IT288_07160 [Bdellovibrionales bacterium]|nr:hypothetical protein [Bdellovibrionales bacterium]